MAKTKTDLLADAQAAGLVADDASPDDFKASDLEAMLTPGRPAWEGTLSARTPQVAPDGHVVLSQEDIDRANADA